MKYARFLFPILLGLPLGHAVSAELSTDQEKFSYTIGFQIGSGIKRDGLDVDADALTQAIKDVLSGSPAQLSREEMQAALQRYQDKQRQKQQTLAEARTSWRPMPRKLACNRRTVACSIKC